MRSSKPSFASAAVLALAAALCCAGCKAGADKLKADTEKLRGEGFSGPGKEMGGWAKSLRPKTPGVDPYTFDNRAREIESNLGVR